MKTIHLITVVFLFLITALHLIRIMTGIDVVVNGWLVPFWLNAILAFVTGLLGFLLWRDSQ